MDSIQRRLQDAGVTLPPAPKPVAAYVPSVRAGDLVFVSGQIPLSEGVLTAEGPYCSSYSSCQFSLYCKRRIIDCGNSNYS